MSDRYYADQPWDTLVHVIAYPESPHEMRREVLDELLIRLDGNKQAIVDILAERFAINAPLGTLDEWVPRRFLQGPDAERVTSDERLRPPDEGTSIRMLSRDGLVVSHVVINSYVWGPPHRDDWVVAVCEGHSDPRHRTLLRDQDGWYITQDP